MKRTTMFLDEAVERDLRLLAAREDRSVASLVREALTEYIAGRRQARAPRLGFVAAGRSGTSDTAERHEDLVFAALDPDGEVVPSRASRAKRSAARARPVRARKAR